MTVTRGAGSWSRQTAPAVDGTTFIVLGTDQNTGRFSYVSALGRSALLIEPTRTNVVGPSKLTDTVPADGLPDGWAATAGVAAVDFATAAGSPTGGNKFRLLDTATAYRGGVFVMALAATTQYAMSVWVRRTAAGAAQLLGIETDPATYSGFTLQAVAHDWARATQVATTVGAGGDVFLLTANTDPAGIVEIACPQVEAGAYATSPILGDVSVTRAAELCALNAGVVGATSGFLGFTFVPEYAQNTFSTIHTLFEWAPNWRLDYNGGTDTFDVVVNGTIRATSAAQTFSAGAIFRLGVRYGAGGTVLTVDQSGVGAAQYTNATAWGSPALAPYLGSRAASANCEGGYYADLLLAA